MRHDTTDRARAARGGRSERGVALIIVLILLSLMMILGMAIAMTGITEVSVSANSRQAAEAFNTADAGITHAYELVKNMKGDFTDLLRGSDWSSGASSLRNGNEFAAWGPAPYWNLDGTTSGQTVAQMFDTSAVTTIPKASTSGRAIAMVDKRHFYELAAYDDAYDTKVYLADQDSENTADTAHNPSVDGNRRVLVRSIGYVTNTDVADANSFNPDASYVIATATVDAVIGLNPFPAIITNNNLTISNSVNITGDIGSVHANGTLNISGISSGNIEGSATWTGSGPTSDSSVGGFVGQSGFITLPDLSAYSSSIAPYGDVVFIDKSSEATKREAFLKACANGDATKYAALVLAINTAVGGSADVIGGSSLSKDVMLVKNTAVAAGYDVTAASSPSYSSGGYSFDKSGIGGLGSSGKTVIFISPNSGGPSQTMSGNQSGKITIVTTGSMKITGTPVLTSNLKLQPPLQPPWDTANLLILCGEDIDLQGNSSSGDVLTGEGVVYCHEQFDGSGHGHINGQLVAYDKELVWDAITRTYKSSTTSLSRAGSYKNVNSLTGNFQLQHEIGTGYLGSFAQVSWRQLRDFKRSDAY